MSIINDALKKTQASLQKNSTATKEPVKEKLVAVSEPKTSVAEPKPAVKVPTQTAAKPSTVEPAKVAPAKPMQQPPPAVKRPVVDERKIVAQPPPVPKTPVVPDSKGITKPPTTPPKKNLATIEQREKETKTEKIPVKSSASAYRGEQGPGDFSPVVRVFFLIIIFAAILALFIYKNPLHWDYSKLSLPFGKHNTQTTQKKKLLALFGKTNQATERKKVNGLLLEGVITQNGKQFALINNEVYQEGSIVQGKKILSISLEKVILLDSAGSTITLINKPASKNN